MWQQRLLKKLAKIMDISSEQNKNQQIHKRKVKNLQIEVDRSEIRDEVKLKVEAIKSKQPLINRFSALLSDQLNTRFALRIFDSLKILRSVDCTIQFLRLIRQTSTRSLRKILYESQCMEFSFKFIQKLASIDRYLFHLEWLNNVKQKKFGLSLTVPIIHLEDARIQQTRKKIVGFLLIQQVGYLVANNLKKEADKWSNGFNPNSIELPCKDISIHPNIRNAEIGQLSRAQINAFASSILRSIIHTVKQTSDSHSLCSNDVVSVIFKRRRTLRQRIISTNRSD